MASQPYSDQVILAPPLPARAFHSTGFEVTDPSQMRGLKGPLPGRRSKLDCAVVPRSQFRARSYLVIDAHLNTLNYNQELQVFNHLASITKEHSGRFHVRQLKDSFNMKSRNSETRLFRYGTSKHKYLHSNQLRIAVIDDSILPKVKEDEIRSPSAKKQVGDTMIYASRYILDSASALVISNFGHARIGNKHGGNAVLVPYQAPERCRGYVEFTALDFPEPEVIFGIDDKNSEELNDARPLAAMTALLGPPPSEVLTRASKYWDLDGRKIKGACPTTGGT
ncbi:protein kinase-like protein [Drepanopeziza brunnea f. sp. 'multigermtubi' MB_m1]|uniref:Protein kinase-like protein n=1 Tax=Marssonina brunnea f. sp. multigermtubi (strain MB_m1) TaxID=1072389 RepID=K1XY62_MARBU|nr:protein kinase-like protein [Drepanopeziza brunnea f. sp. 'multigermtubi' MB_m1]EKD17739.1 protein kinase-like protein [Drepanopeziza brunnea f. sp. 'multigermtubi' MB_m1]